MNTEDTAWNKLGAHAASRLSPGFADRVLLEARAPASPLLVAHFAMCAATAGLCLAAVALYRSGTSAADEARNLAGWSEIAAQSQELDQGL